MGQFSRAELEAEFQLFEDRANTAAVTHDWDQWADQFAIDAEYVEHAMGNFGGREEIRPWIKKTMSRFPGNHMTSFPSLWHVIDEDTARVICEIDNPLRDPGDGSVHSATNITILTYGGDGRWAKEEDIYNPMKFLESAKGWCLRARELGTITDEAATWFDRMGRF
ncbi:SnoaL-like domain-containing protein [Gordonia sp. TBRC 11910]|uniref:SnoaL-like domain-containing protein n=1 Tax=Gordonia asplenii TaxID=2725283 RepID=A0A848KV73_9ACTN|nr:nuclear transport factor 2 family protein [Gordonia asplenii]NMO02566.1 SnoaL-like domain-containing protein [Gordonia asplenii]